MAKANQLMISMNRAPAWSKKKAMVRLRDAKKPRSGCAVGVANSGYGETPRSFDLHQVFEALAHAGRMPRERKQHETSRPKIQDLRRSKIEQRYQEKLKYYI